MESIRYMLFCNSRFYFIFMGYMIDVGCLELVFGRFRIFFFDNLVDLEFIKIYY